MLPFEYVAWNFPLLRVLCGPHGETEIISGLHQFFSLTQSNFS